MGKTLFDKIWDKHVVKKIDDETDVIYIDTHLIHEVTSPQAFDLLREKNIKVFRSQNTFAVPDHNVPTIDRHLPIRDGQSRSQVEALYKNCADHNIRLFSLEDSRQGIVHVIGPELGITQPGKILVCGDSHTSTHGALGAIAFGIGTSQAAQVLASQCLVMKRPKKMRITVNGLPGTGAGAKDIALHVIRCLGTNGAAGYFVEYCGETIDALSVEGRMTLCNMSIEMGARGGMCAPDEKTFNYIKGKEFAPKEKWDEKYSEWKELFSDSGSVFDREEKISAEGLLPVFTYGTNPAMGIQIGETIPHNEGNDSTFSRAMEYMQFKSGENMSGKKIDYVFIGSCTNSRIEDLRTAAHVVKGKKKAAHINAFIVPGSKQVRKQAQEEGLEKIFNEAGFELRQPGCSACLAMNDDKIPPGAICMSTSNRNFEGRQGPGSRTILAGPFLAAITAIEGIIPDLKTIELYGKN